VVASHGDVAIRDPLVLQLCAGAPC
jgi:hypothetical protein